MLSEQGAESIHAQFNQLEKTYSNMTNKVEKMKCIVKEHLRQVCPDNIVKQPPAKKRLKMTEE